MTPVAKKLINVNPNTLSWIGLILAFAAGIIFYLSGTDDEWEWMLVLGAVIVLVSGYFDAIDGKVAKLSGKASKKGDLLDHVFDRYADVFIIGGVAVSTWCSPYIGMAALVGVLLTSYMGTQAQAVGAPRLYAGLLGRADRIVLSIFFPMLQFVWMYLGYGEIDVFGLFVSSSWLEIMLIWFAVIGNITAVQRAVTIWRSMPKEE